MPEIVNTGQAAAWSGQEGQHWARYQDRYDLVNSGFNQTLMRAAAIARRDRVLDVGCGAGQLTRLAALQAADGKAVGIDLSRPILECARAAARRDSVTNVEFVYGDAQVYPLPPGSFDVAVSRFGVMFFEDAVAAFANIRDALHPGGRLAFVCLRALSDSGLGTVLTEAAARARVPSPSAAGGFALAGAFSLADPDVIRRLLAEAGFGRIGVEAVDADQVWGTSITEAAAFLEEWGPMRAWLNSIDQQGQARLREALRAELARYLRRGEVRLPGAGWLGTAARAVDAAQVRE